MNPVDDAAVVWDLRIALDAERAYLDWLKFLTGFYSGMAVKSRKCQGGMYAHDSMASRKEVSRHRIRSLWRSLRVVERRLVIKKLMQAQHDYENTHTAIAKDRYDAAAIEASGFAVSELLEAD